MAPYRVVTGLVTPPHIYILPECTRQFSGRTAYVSGQISDCPDVTSLIPAFDMDT